MKTPNSFRNTLLAAGIAGGAIMAAANAPFAAILPLEAMIGLGASLALFAIAVQDYCPRAALLLPAKVVAPEPPARVPARSSAYGIRRVRRERPVA